MGRGKGGGDGKWPLLGLSTTDLLSGCLNGSLRCWVGDPAHIRREQAGDRQTERPANNCTKTQHGRSDWTVGKWKVAVRNFGQRRQGKDGTLSSYRECRERDLPGHRDLGGQERSGYPQERGGTATEKEEGEKERQQM